MNPRLLLACLLMVAAAPSVAQVRPQSLGGDARIQYVDYRPDQVVLIEVAPGYQTTLELSPDEQIENVAVGDSSAWQVTGNRRGDRLFIKPVQPGVTTNMTVITSQRMYAIELATSFGSSSAYVVRFRHPPERSLGEAVFDYVLPGRYKLRGDRWLHPARIGDDGHRTYIHWPAERPLPAVYSRESADKDVLLNGYMRDGVFVLDTVVPMLVFRIDRGAATARRLNKRARR